MRLIDGKCLLEDEDISNEEKKQQKEDNKNDLEIILMRSTDGEKVHEDLIDGGKVQESEANNGLEKEKISSNYERKPQKEDNTHILETVLMSSTNEEKVWGVKDITNALNTEATILTDEKELQENEDCKMLEMSLVVSIKPAWKLF